MPGARRASLVEPGSFDLKNLTDTEGACEGRADSATAEDRDRVVAAREIHEFAAVDSCLEGSSFCRNEDPHCSPRGTPMREPAA